VVGPPLAEFEAAGMDAHNANPVRAARLFAVIDEVLEAGETPEMAAAAVR
jgi:hypothetical protein